MSAATSSAKKDSPLFGRMEPMKIVPVEQEELGRVSFANLYLKEFTQPTSSENLQALLASPDPQITPEQARRDPNNGAWTFKPNTEEDLLNHVHLGLTDYISSFNDVDSAEAILRSIDVYCLGKQWMYHIGQEKGEILKEFLSQCIQANAEGSRPLVFVELGTYCGYSAILLAKTARQLFPTLNFHLYSFEKNNHVAQIAKQMIQMAKLESYITVILTDPKKESLSNTLAHHVPSRQMDFLLLDHAKDKYLPDLMELEQAGFVTKGTHVAADNVIISNELAAYRDHCAKLALQQVVSTKMVAQKLEYTDSRQNFKDGIELTIYLQDPK